MYCKKCGKEIREDSKFCVHCGATVQMGRAQEQSVEKERSQLMEKREKNIPIVAVVLGILLVIAIIVVVILLGNKGNNTETKVTESSSSEITEEVEAKITTSEEMSVTIQEPETVTTEMTTQEKPITNAECMQIISEMKKSDFRNTEAEESLLGLAQILVFSQLDCANGVLLTELSGEKQKQLNDAIVDGVKYRDFLDGELEFVNDWMYSLDEALPLFKDVYSCEEITYAVSNVGGNLVEMADLRGGGPWLRLSEGRIWENNNYYLLSGAYYYGYNGAETEWFEGYIDVLFWRNNDSRFGVNMLYAKTDKTPKVVSSVETTSVLESQEGKSYSGKKLIDGKTETAWVEGVDGVGKGEIITLYLEESTEVQGLEIWNGYLASAELYDKNGKVNKIMVDFGNGVVIQKEIPVLDAIMLGGMDGRDYIFFIGLDEPVVTDTITITILDAEAGNKYEDTCISEIKVY